MPLSQQQPLDVRSRRRLLRSTAAVGVALLLVPAVAWASHQYSDVPDSHTFHDAITALTDAGIASGTGGGLFKPQDPVTRGQMAAFIHRSAGRIAFDDTLASIGTVGETLLGSATLKLVGPTGGTQVVIAEANIQLDHDDALGAACFPSLLLRRAGSAAVLGSWSIEFYAQGVGEEKSVSATFASTQGSGSTVTWELYGTNDCGQTLFTDEDMFTVRNIAFEGDGTAPSLTELSLPDQEADREE